MVVVLHYKRGRRTEPATKPEPDHRAAESKLHFSGFRRYPQPVDSGSSHTLLVTAQRRVAT
jgi:hypothetical protein